MAPSPRGDVSSSGTMTVELTLGFIAVTSCMLSKSLCFSMAVVTSRGLEETVTLQAPTPRTSLLLITSLKALTPNKVPAEVRTSTCQSCMLGVRVLDLSSSLRGAFYFFIFKPAPSLSVERPVLIMFWRRGWISHFSVAVTKSN